MRVFFQVFGITCAVVLAVFLGNVAFTKYQLYEARSVVGEITGSFDSASRDLTEMSRLKHSVNNLTRANKKLSQDLILAQKQLRAYQLAKTAKQQAFAKYHTDSDDCLIFDSDAHMVECQNVKMRAKKEFERLWQSGQRSF